MNSSYVEDPIDFLVSRKYPLGYLLALNSQGKIDQEECKKRQTQVEDYKKELKGKSEEEIKDLYDTEKQKHQNEIELKLAKEEKLYFFNQPTADADLKLWGKAACWTLEEALALCFGKNPALVSWDKIKSFTSSSFVKRYGELRFLALRAKAANLLYDTLIPGFFIDWAKLNKIDYPQELEEEVIANGEKITNWKNSYDKLLKNYNDLSQILEDYKNLYASNTASMQEIFEKMRTVYEKRINFLDNKREQELTEITSEQQKLSDQIKKYEQQLKILAQKEKPLGTRAQDTLLKIIAAVCVDSYGYDSRQAKNKSLADIRNALAQIDQTLGDDTIRDKLKQASSFIPSDYYTRKES